MPIATVQILEGRSDEQKARLIAAVSQAISESVGAPPDSVRVIVVEVPKTHWGVGGKTMKELGR